MTRKNFIQQCVHGSVGLTLTVLYPTLVGGCKTLPVQSAKADHDIVRVEESMLGVDTQMIVRVDGRRMEPILLTRRDDGSYSAVLMRCTHKGCELRNEGVVLSCPCHGSEFSSEGDVLSPPAQESLEKFHVVVQNSTILISLHKP